MQEQLFLDLRKAIANRNIHRVNDIQKELLSLDSDQKDENLFWKLRIEAEIHHFRRNYSQAISILEEAQNLQVKLSLTDNQIGSLRGRYGSCLYSIENYEKAHEEFSKAKDLSGHDIPRSYYYRLRILQCLLKLDRKSDYYTYYFEIIDSLFTNPLEKVWNHHLDYAWNLISSIQTSNWFEEIKKLTFEYSPDKTEDYTSSLLYFLFALLSRSESKYDEMITHMNFSLSAFREGWNVNDQKKLLLNCASLVRYPFSDFATAQTLLEKALALSPDPDGWRAQILNSLGSVSRFTGNYPRAIQVLEESIDISRKLPYLYQLGFAYNTLGMVYTLLGENLKAKKAFESSLDCNIKEKDFVGQGYTFGSMGWLESVLNNFESANVYYSKSIDAFEMFGRTPPIILLAKAEVLSQIHNYMTPDIEKLLKNAHELIWKRKTRLDKGRYYITLGHIYFNFKDYSRAEKNYLESLKFDDIYEVYSQGLLGIIKVKTFLYIESDDINFMNQVKTKLSTLNSLTQENSLLWAEMNLISSIIDISEGKFGQATNNLKLLRTYSENHGLIGLQSRILKQEDYLAIYQKYMQIQDQIQNQAEIEKAKSQSLMDVLDYLKAISRLLTTHSTDTKSKDPK
jgi:tetratricopeptide (TPR) repeat protein